jgi:hypothetical protein
MARWSQKWQPWHNNFWCQPHFLQHIVEHQSNGSRAGLFFLFFNLVIWNIWPIFPQKFSKSSQIYTRKKNHLSTNFSQFFVRKNQWSKAGFFFFFPNKWWPRKCLGLDVANLIYFYFKKWGRPLKSQKFPFSFFPFLKNKFSNLRNFPPKTLKHNGTPRWSQICDAYLIMTIHNQMRWDEAKKNSLAHNNYFHRPYLITLWNIQAMGDLKLVMVT